MQTIIELISNISTIIFSFLKEVTEEEIEKNIAYLKQEEWFQKYLEDDKYNELIFDTIEVRHIIGAFNSKKMSQSRYHRKHQKRIERELEKHSSLIAGER
ncbi:hypothetical protein DVB69_15415 [Sporosarcina sp. BI001-red]|uniref:hypothetical protein n=1 Tax=Sporosarcina sp. BI001-red TaxID=2282866 RepID=UPI000E220CF4|nr:hypothetical protein [Sporosarcina sp. BI001-red]REB05152.1 hypothetical protein DVB69_15415 [Sporosarcina sp. BI001-red]